MRHGWSSSTFIHNNKKTAVGVPTIIINRTRRKTIIFYLVFFASILPRVIREKLLHASMFHLTIIPEKKKKE